MVAPEKLPPLPDETPPLVDAVVGGIAGVCRWGFLGAVAGPLVWLGAVLWVRPAFNSIDNYCVASLVGVLVGAGIGLIGGALDGWLSPRPILLRDVLVSLGGIAVVLAVGAPCSGFCGALAGIAYWSYHRIRTR